MGDLDTSTTRDTELLRLYSKDALFNPAERNVAKFYPKLQEFKNERPGGSGRRFRIVGASSHAVGTPEEGGDWSDTETILQLEGVVTSAQIDASIGFSDKFLALAEGDGSYSGDAEHEGILRTTKDLISYADILMGVGHGTGRLAVVSASVTSDTVVCDDPEMAFQLRPNMRIEFVNQETGGTVQDTTKIESIDYKTGTLTLEDVVAVTAGWGIYKSGTYGKPKPNGVRNIVDDGDFATSIFGNSRTSPNTYLNATVMDGDGGYQDLSEALIDELLDQITWRQEFVPTELRCNKGLISEYKRFTTPDRIWTQAGDAPPPSFQTGANYEKFSHLYGNTKIPFEVDRNLPARELYALHIPSFRRHTLVEPDWKKIGGQILLPKPATDTYAHSLIGNMMMDITISTRCLNANGKLSNVRDRSAAGDSA